MKNIDLLPISEEAKKRLNEFALQYRKFAKVFIEIVSFSNNWLIVRVEQKELVNGKQLTRAELINRASELFKGEIPEEWKVSISAADFDRKDIDNVNAEWINKKLEKLNLKAKHISSHTGIDKSSLSLLLSGTRELTKWHKVAFYYFFKYMELSNFKNES
jgi:hypothetical protein